MVEVTIEDLAMTTVLRGNLSQKDGDVVLLRAQRSNLPCVIANTRRVCGNLICSEHSEAISCFTEAKPFLKAQIIMEKELVMLDG